MKAGRVAEKQTRAKAGAGRQHGYRAWRHANARTQCVVRLWDAPRRLQVSFLHILSSSS